MSESRRIVLVLARAAGGVGFHVASLAREFAREGHAVGVVGPPETDATFGFSSIPGVKFAVLDVPVTLGPRDRRTWRRLGHLVTSFDAEIVHAHGFRAGLLTVLATAGIPRRRRPLTVVTWHNTVSGGGVRGRAERTIAALVARRADVTLAASADLRALAEELGASDPKLAPVAAPRRPLEGTVNGSSVRRGLLAATGAHPDDLMVLSIGRVAPQKNYELLLDAAALWKADHPRIRALVAGSADEALRARLASRIEAENLPVRFLGQRDDITSLLHAADIFLITSHWEARALVVQEAMAAGRAIVATAVGGLPELLDGTGVLVEPNARAVADAVLRLAADPDERERLGHAAGDRALGFPDEAAAASAVLASYEARTGR